jgi:transcriptional regulator with XRE-family HTH domain
MPETLPPELTPGERIRVLRERRGLSRAVLANLVGRGPDWLKKIERGERELRDYTLLVRLATALGVTDLSVITGGTTSVPVDASSRLILPFVGEIRDAVRGSLFSSPSQDGGSGVVREGDRVVVGDGAGLWRLAADVEELTRAIIQTDTWPRPPAHLRWTGHRLEGSTHLSPNTELTRADLPAMRWP